MPSFVEISVNVPQISGIFDYHLPPELEGKVGVGCLVAVPFGKKTVQGIVLRSIAEPQVTSTRPVEELIDPEPVVTLTQIRLAQWMAEQSLAPLAACLDRMLPPGLSQRAETVYQRVNGPDGKPVLPASGRALPEEGSLQARLLDLLERRGALRSGQIEHAFKEHHWRSAMHSLARRGLVSKYSQLPPPSVRPKTVRTAQLACPPHEAEAALPRLGRQGSKALLRRQAIVNFLIREPWPVDLPWIAAQTGGTWPDVQSLAEIGLVVLGESELWRDPLANIEAPPDDPPPLTADQEQAWQRLRQGLTDAAGGKKQAPFILHGVTGSGKTEIYLQAVAETLRQGRQAIVLVPEIALTPQTVRRFMARFPGQVGLVHHRLTDGERYDTWRRARAGKLAVIVGPRSALFAPLPALGLIVVDESHDESYYQAELPPFYHAVRVAMAYAYAAGAVCLLGSATPDVASLYQAESGNWPRLRLPVRILAHRQAVERQAARLGLGGDGEGARVEMPDEGLAARLYLPEISVVDMRQELKAGNRSIFSRELQKALGQVLDAGQQAILFLNRRGTATFVFCRECGFSLRCPRCDIPLTFHTGHSSLACHYCGYHRKLPGACPQCKSASLRQYGTGTEKVETEIQALFPQARTLRWDAESTREKGSHEVILAHFSAQRANVLIGTQMLAKGLDLPMVTLVGAVLADVGLNLPDYRASERTFQVLTQVAGRAGRSLLGGRVILQTFQPEHYAIRAAACHDYDAFYRQELAYRRQLGYPPFYRLARLEFRHKEAEKAEEAAAAMAGQIDGWLASGDRRATERIGPVPCFFAQINGIYRWQIVLRGPDPASLLRGKSLGDWRVEVDPPNLL